MSDQATISEVVNVILSAANEFGSWAAHYDSARFNVTALIITIVAAGAGFSIGSSRKEIRIGGLIGVALVGLSLTGLSGEYYRLYLESAHTQFKMRQLATNYVTGDLAPKNFSLCKINEKIYQARLEVFPVSQGNDLKNLKDDCEQKDYFQAQYKQRGTLFSFPVLVKVLGSLWMWLCIIYSVGIPGACLVFNVQRTTQE